MRIFVHEYVCGGGLAGKPLPESLRREGWAMLRAVVEDFARCPGVEIGCLLDARLSASASELSGARVDLCDPGAEQSLFHEFAADADFTLVIAPESKQQLYLRCRWVEQLGSKLLGPSPEAVHLAGDKVQLAVAWGRYGVRTPAWVWRSLFGTSAQQVVCKPRRGGGSLNSFLIQNHNDLSRALQHFRADPCGDEPIFQEYLPGLPASLSLILGRGWSLALPAAAQHLSDDGRFRYLGGRAPLPDNLNDRAQRLALQAIAPIDGLSGWVGVDLILGDAADGSEDYAIEINPRLTTSYVGLRALAEFNLAETMLALALAKPLPERRYRNGVVRWTADGTVQWATVQ
jgi:predicted ATP-grasp superfamily ATP-dependent carboligase